MCTTITSMDFSESLSYNKFNKKQHLLPGVQKQKGEVNDYGNDIKMVRFQI